MKYVTITQRGGFITGAAFFTNKRKAIDEARRCWKTMDPAEDDAKVFLVVDGKFTDEVPEWRPR